MSTETRGYVITGVKSASYSKLSVPGYTTIKYRTKPSAVDRAAMKEELRQKEGKGIDAPHSRKRTGTAIDSSEEPISKKPKLEEKPEEELEEELQVEINPLDRDDSDSEPEEKEKGSNAGSDDEDDDEDDSDDDDEELQEIQRQLERIKREKAEEKERKEREEAEEARRNREDRMAQANPLMQGDGTGSRVAVKKWYEETIFKNQAAGEQQYKKRFINDTVRNDFHKRFLAKYVR